MFARRLRTMHGPTRLYTSTWLLLAVALPSVSALFGETTPEELVAHAFKASSAGRRDEALVFFLQALKLQPDNANALIQLGMQDMKNPKYASEQSNSPHTSSEALNALSSNVRSLVGAA